jgi:hypothetical protein
MSDKKRGVLRKPKRKKTPKLKRKPLGQAETTKELLKALNKGIADADKDSGKKK